MVQFHPRVKIAFAAPVRCNTSKILEFICGSKVILARTINFMNNIKIVNFPGVERCKVVQFAECSKSYMNVVFELGDTFKDI